MAETATKLPLKNEEKKGAEPSPVSAERRPFESLRRELDRLVDDFDHGAWRLPFRRSMFDVEPFWRRELTWAATPAVDIVEKDNEYEITAELPGMDENNVDVKVANGMLTIKGEKTEEKEEKTKDSYLSERRYGSFQRQFSVPDGVNVDRIEATFKNGVLTVILPKAPEAQKPEKKISIKTS